MDHATNGSLWLDVELDLRDRDTRAGVEVLRDLLEPPLMDTGVSKVL